VSTLDEIERRLRSLEDISAIRELKHRYLQSADRTTSKGCAPADLARSEED